jgi:hypothetical protein
MDLEVIPDNDCGHTLNDGSSIATRRGGLTLISTHWVIDIDPDYRYHVL